MKKSIPGRVASLHYPGLGLLLILLTFNSCRKDSEIGRLDPQVIRQGSLVNESRLRFNRDIGIRPLVANDNKLRHRAVKTPLWDQAEQVQITVGQALKVPLAYDQKLYLQIGQHKEQVPIAELSYLLIYKDQNQQQHAEVVIQIPDQSYWQHRNERNRKFSGIIMVEDWWGRPIKTFKKTAQQQVMMLANLSQAIQKRQGEEKHELEDDDCEVVVTTGPEGMYEVELICSGGDGSNGGGGGGQGGGGGWGFPSPGGNGGGGEGGPNPGRDYDDRPRGGGGGGGNHNPPPPDNRSDITNNVSNFCLKAVVNDLKSSNLGGKIGEIISALDRNTKVQINVLDAQEVYNQNGVSIPAKFQANPASPNGVFSGTITINRNTLLPTTKENTAAVIIHEVVHAYLNYTNPLNTWDNPMEHTIISDKYIIPMANYLSGLYSISKRDATALAWSGLDNSAIYISLTNFDYPGGILSKEDISNISRDYIMKYSGHQVCNVED